MTPFDPRDYPGARPHTAVLVFGGRTVAVEVTGSAAAPVRSHLDAPVLEPGAVRWSLAYGSNASPARLVAKRLDRRGALLLPAVASGWVAAYEGRRTRYGAVPVTLVPAPGAHLPAWVLGVHHDDLGVLDVSEGRYEGAPEAVTADAEVMAPPGAYELAVIGEVAVADRFLLPDALAYVPGPRTLLQVVGRGYRTWPEWDQRAATDHLDEGGPLDAAPPASQAVTRGWPDTPLSDLPLFVYGSLQPRGPAWDLIADVVEVVGPATALGRLFDSGRGWPAAVFGGAGADVHGTLVAARDPAAAAELVRRADTYEAVPDLFVRTSVRVVAAARPVWAMAYAWSGTDAPGLPVPDGRWPGADTDRP